MRCIGSIASMVSVLIAAAASDDAVRIDLDKFRGEWRLTSVERDGKKTPPEELIAIKLTIQANKFVLRKDSVVISEGVFTLDPTRKPKEIDETITAGPNRGKLFQAVYSDEGPSLATQNRKALAWRASPRQSAASV
jgi:uncharacterized protein (TIGR03067 family)